MFLNESVNRQKILITAADTMILRNVKKLKREESKGGRERRGLGFFLSAGSQIVNSKCAHSDCQLIHYVQISSRLVARQMDDLSTRQSDQPD
jgi:hypothetical protein